MQRFASRLERKYTTLPSGDHAGSPPSGLTRIHSRSGAGEPRHGAMKTRVCAPVEPAANAIHRPSGEKRAANRLLTGCESTVCRSSVAIFSNSTVFDCPGRNVSRLEPSGDQSQIPKQPFSVENRRGGATCCRSTAQVRFTGEG